LRKRIFISDCEGPIGSNDNAFELTSHFVPDGDQVFAVLDKYDHVYSKISKKRDYAEGNTSRLVLPFLLAYDVTNRAAEEFCSSTLTLRKGSKETLNYLQEVSMPFIVSTSYEHYLRVLCKEVGFPLGNTFCSQTNFDKYQLTPQEKSKLRFIAREIAAMSSTAFPLYRRSHADSLMDDKMLAKRLDKILWKDIAKMHCGEVISDVNTAPSTKKVHAIQHIINLTSSSLENVMYVCNDVADPEAVTYVREGGGLVVAVNGDETALRNANVAVLSDNSVALTVLADIFLRFGKAKALEAAGNFDRDSLWKSSTALILLNSLFEFYPGDWPKVRILSEWNMAATIKESNATRQNLRAEPANSPVSL
jgi:energy-converting hydrogenase A subunit R